MTDRWQIALGGQVESYLDKCIEWFQKALKFFAKQETVFFLWYTVAQEDGFGIQDIQDI